MNKLLISVLVIACLSGITVCAQEDAEDCKDHPMFTRMPGFYINSCENNWNAVEFWIGEDKTVNVEGDKTFLSYYLMDGANKPSDLQIQRNFQNAVKSIGGTLVFQYGELNTFKLIKGSQETWIQVSTHDTGGSYDLTIVTKKAMTQDITASAMLDALNKDGFIALYINFDTDKATIKSESQAVITEIVALLKANLDLKLSIEGHTDSTGNPQHNKQLSEQRAKAVLAAITADGIAATRVWAIGWGQEKPIADNRSEEGRAKNRRVELVKK